MADFALVEELSRIDPAHPIPSEFLLPLHRRHISPPLPPTSPIPVIDLSGLESELARPHTLAHIHRACAHWGIFHVTNHGVPDAVLEQLQLEIERFLALPVDERMPRVLGNQGEGYGTGFVRREVGVTEWRDCLRILTYPEAQRDYNVWPKSQQFRHAIEEYSKETQSLQQKMLACLSRNLGLRPSYLEDTMGEIQQRILINHYPPCPNPTLAAGVDQHTDIGALTCLWLYDNVIGLQVFKDGDWIPVEPISGALTIIVGDQIEIATNGIYKSILHRGVLNATHRRISVVIFYHLKPDQVVGPAPELIDAEHPVLYQPTRYGDRLTRKGDHVVANK